MNQEPQNYTLTQISFLVKNLTKKNFAQNCRLLSQFIEEFGLEADRHYLRCLCTAINFSDPIQTSLHCKLLCSELVVQLKKPSIISTICYVIENCFNNKLSILTSNFVTQFCEVIGNCSEFVELIITLALINSTKFEIVYNSSPHLKNIYPRFIQFYVKNETKLNDISPNLLEFILKFISWGKHSRYNIRSDQFKKFIGKLKKEFFKEKLLSPYLYSNFSSDSDCEESVLNCVHNLNSLKYVDLKMMDTSWQNLIMEIGYGFTTTFEECKNHLTKTCSRDISAQDAAKIIGLICRAHTNLSDCKVNLPTPSNFWPNHTVNDNSNSDKKDLLKNGIDSSITWKPDVFVQALRDIAPNLNWKEVCVNLDHPEFIIKDRIGLNLLMTIIRLASPTGVMGYNLLVDSLYRHWQNVDGQYSLVSNILKNPDLLSFADYIYTPVSVELLKTPPEMDNKEIATWKSLYLVDILLYLADNGYVQQVAEIFKFPVQNCPDVLFMALLQISPPLTMLRQELFASLIPTFLGNHPNSGVILHHAWNSSNFIHTLRPIIMHAMSDWYTRGENDQSKLSRILDVAQDLKALSSLLNVRSFMFVIDLACLASRREYLKLEKWLSDKIRDHGESFVQAMVKFLQRRCPQITGVKIPDDQIPKGSSQLPHESVTTMLTCLQVCIGNVSQELSDTIVQMMQNCNIIVHKARQQPPPGVLRTHRPLETNPFNTNLSAQQMFGPAIDSMPTLNTNMAGLSLGGTFNFGNVLGNLVSTPASPSRLIQAPSNSPFTMMSIQAAPPNVNNLAARIQPTLPTTDNKIHIPATPAGLPDFSLQLSKEVEDEANSYFQRIYNHPPRATLSIDEVLDMLQRFKDSNIRREQEVYQCMLRNLFEEYRFFPQYPEKELQITAQLFGGIIDRNLVPTCVALGLALRCVLDALRKPEGSKMYYFGITALDRFKTRLHQYNKYCEYVRSIPHFQDFPPHLIQYVEYGYQSMEPPNKPQGPILPPSTAHLIPPTQPSTQTQPDNQIYRSNSVTGNIITTPTQPTKPIINTQPIHPSRVKSIATATNIDTLLIATADRDEKITTPPDEIQDKTAFIFNNLSQLNLQQKCDEIKEIMTKEYWPWMAQYLVLKRASIELNFHSLYSNFLDALKNPEIIRLVTQETFRNIKVLLRSDKGIANFSDRSLLKNLGHWLGMMTLARNKPILIIDIDLKSLLVEAYHKGQQELLYVVPFVAKVLESCAKSKVFKPPNPWTMAIMNVLGELHQEQDLKLNLKFEIEVLCKTLSIDITELKPIIYLRDAEIAKKIEYQLSQQNVNKPKDIPPPVVEESANVMGSTANANPSPITNNENVGQIHISAPEPRFNYNDISISNFSSLTHHIVISPNITNLLHTNPPLKHIVLSSIERTINEWLQIVVERSVRIGVSTCEQIIRKDFALDPDETRMRTAAHYMVRNLTAGLAMITCKDQLIQSLQSNIKKAFLTMLAQPPNLLDAESTAIQLAADNAELACAFIQKNATEKAAPEIDRRLANDFDMRKLARDENRRYCDADILAYQMERMPEQVRLKVGVVPATQFAVYEEFARTVPGFQPLTERDAMFHKNIIMDSINSFANDEYALMYTDLLPKIEGFLNNAVNISAIPLQTSKMHSLMTSLMVARRQREADSAMNLINRVVDGLLEGIANIPEHADQIKLYKEIHFRVLNYLNNTYGSSYLTRATTKCIFDCREEIRYNIEAVKLLINAHFVNIQQFDLMLTQIMDNGNNYLAVNFAMQLIQHYLIDERSSALLSEQDLYNTIDLLVRLAAHHRGPEGLTHLIDLLRLNHDLHPIPERAPAGPTQFIHLGLMHVKSSDYEDPPGLQDKTEYLVKDWLTSYMQLNGRDCSKLFNTFASKLSAYGIIKTDELITRFFRQATQFVMDLARRNLSDASYNQSVARKKIVHWMDAFVRMIVLLIRHSGDGANPNAKTNLLNKVLGIALGILLQDQELHGTAFQQLGYHRFFLTLFAELSTTDPIYENLMMHTVTAFCHTYHLLNPSTAPGFCYSWLELISHRSFVGKILSQIPQQKGWSMYAQLLLDLFKYLAPFLRNAELAKPVQLLYKGTLRVLLVLLHDFPEFLCDYHFGFCDVIPPNCIQMRNIILAAFPRNMRLPDPFTPNLKVDMLPETSAAPRIFTNYIVNIQPQTFKKDLDLYLKLRAPVTFLSELRSHLQISNEPGSKYNIPLMNALVLYVGIHAITQIRNKNTVPNTTTISHSSHMDIFQNLAVDLDHEGRYLFLNAIANQLRYPNSHTHYFSCAVLYLFAEANSEAIQEQITRVLLERLIVNRPHPWGLLITFIELIKNPAYKFWEHDFVHCAPEIEKLFESVARSCMVKANNQHLQNSDNEVQECN